MKGRKGNVGDLRVTDDSANVVASRPRHHQQAMLYLCDALAHYVQSIPAHASRRHLLDILNRVQKRSSMATDTSGATSTPAPLGRSSSSVHAQLGAEPGMESPTGGQESGLNNTGQCR